MPARSTQFRLSKKGSVVTPVATYPVAHARPNIQSGGFHSIVPSLLPISKHKHYPVIASKRVGDHIGSPLHGEITSVREIISPPSIAAELSTILPPLVGGS